jgi:PhnB protein
MTQRHIRHGQGAVRPYVYCYADTIELVHKAFGAQEVERVPMGSGFHIEARIGDSMIVLEVGEPAPAGATRASIYVYVDDVDQSFSTALKLGAVAISQPEDKPYQERGAGISDRFGNTWWIATYIGGVSR